MVLTRVPSLSLMSMFDTEVSETRRGTDCAADDRRRQDESLELILLRDAAHPFTNGILSRRVPEL